MKICEAKARTPSYEADMRTRPDDAILRIITNRYGHRESPIPSNRYWFRLAVQEAKRRGLS